MSVSEAGSPAASDRTLENQLRLEVKRRFKDGTQESMTINEIRQAAEKSLGLRAGWYVSLPTWKARSKEIVHDETHKQEAAAPDSPVSPAEVTSRSKPVKGAKPSNRPKRISPDDGGRAKKRSKMSEAESESEDSLSSPPSESEEEKPKVKPKTKTKPLVTKPAAKSKSTNGSVAKVENGSESPLSDSQDVGSESMQGKPRDTKAEESESEMSVVIDEPPKPKRRKRESNDVTDGEPKRSKASKAKPDAHTDPDEAEIKRLQGWLVKCGIRKMWWKELKPYESSKAKIKHLKDMLSDVGMTGRYSQEKASQIKEARELAADIEAVKEGAERWGKGNEDPEDDGQSKRRLVRGAKNYDFLSSDGEETD